jgi:vancomycin resistance protein YoaR
VNSKLARLALGLGVGIVVCALVVVALAVRFRTSATICRGVSIATVDVGGLSKDQASSAVQNWAREQASKNITLVALDRRWSGALSDMGVRIDWQPSIEQAYSLGRNDFSLNSIICALTSGGTGKSIAPRVLIDHSRLEKTLHKVAQAVNAPHKDARLKIVDSKLEIQQDVVGLQLDEKAALKAVSKGVQSGQSLIRLPVIPDHPEVTAKDAASINTVLASFSTPFNRGKVGRTHNLTLAAQSIDGIILKPGGVFSMNDTVGPRLAGRGYRIAQIYVQGKLEDGLGGGVCQVSSTLFNAALLAGLTIKERAPHSLVVPYVTPGRDATVAYGQTDFRFQNSAEHPIGIIANAQGSRLVIQIYGSASDKKEVSLSTSVVNRTAAGTKTIIDASLPEGHKQVVTKGSGGLQVVLHRKVKTADGADVSDSFKSTYRPLATLYAVGPTHEPTAE